MRQRLWSQLEHMATADRTTQEWHHPHFMSEATVEEKEAWLHHLLTKHEESSLPHHVVVDCEAYLVVLRALADPWAVSHASNNYHSSTAPPPLHGRAAALLPDAPLRAERWLVRLEQHAEESLRNNNNNNNNNSSKEASSSPLVPTAECYRCVLQAWVNAPGEDSSLAIRRAERWLYKVLHHPTLPVQPNTSCFNAFLDGCSKGRAVKDRRRRRHPAASTSNSASLSPHELLYNHASLAERTLLYMIEHRRKLGSDRAIYPPDTDTFNFVIRAWTRCRTRNDVADRAMETLQLLEEYQNTVDPDVGPNAKSYAMVLDALAVRAKLKVQRIRTQHYLWDDPNANGEHEINLMRDIVAYTENKAKEEGDESLHPNTYAYNTLASAWSHLSSDVHPHAPVEAEKILQRMASHQNDNNCGGFLETTGPAPDAVTYRMVMRAWANSPEPHRGERVAWWLQRQWMDFEFEGREALRPTVDSYNMVRGSSVVVQTFPRCSDSAVSLLTHVLESVVGRSCGCGPTWACR